jgi:hypothetical protein
MYGFGAKIGTVAVGGRIVILGKSTECVKTANRSAKQEQAYPSCTDRKMIGNPQTTLL